MNTDIHLLLLYLFYPKIMTTPVYKSVPQLEAYSFLFKDEIFDYFPLPRHYHNEYELIYVVKSGGIKIIGDFVGSFTSGDLVLIGPGLPHVYISDKSYYNYPGRNVRAIAIQFNKKIFGNEFLELPEMIPVKNMLNEARKGIEIKGINHKNIIKILNGFANLDGMERLTNLLDILRLISANSQNKVLAGESFRLSPENKEIEKFNKMLHYISTNFRNKLSIETASRNIGMSINSFCRYFKKQTGKTFTQYVNNIRIGFACQLLLEKNLSVAAICYECGYENLSYFNRQFKKLKGISPLQFRKKYASINENHVK